MTRIEVFVDGKRVEGETVLALPGATVIVIPNASATADELVPIEHVAELAATSKRVVRDAIRMGELPAFGKQRDRSVRRADLDTWIASRRVRADVGRDDDAIEKRVRRLERERKAAR